MPQFAGVSSPSRPRRTTYARKANIKSDNPNELFLALKSKGDPHTRDQLIEKFMPLARNLARRYDRPTESFDDLIQVASLGLVKAVDRFDPSRGNSFASFAVPTILGELKRYFRGNGWAVHVPRGEQELALRVEDARREITDSQGRAPTVTELAEYLELSVEDVLAAMQTASAYEAVYLQAPRGGADPEETQTYGDSLGGLDQGYELVDDALAVTDALKQLPEREQVVLHLRFQQELTQTEIANRIGVSQMQVSRLLRRSLKQLREITSFRPRPPADE